jgi:hypothetical protein
LPFLVGHGNLGPLASGDSIADFAIARDKLFQWIILGQIPPLASNEKNFQPFVNIVRLPE